MAEVLETTATVTTPTTTTVGTVGEIKEVKVEPVKLKSSEVLRTLSEATKINLFDENGVEALIERITKSEITANEYKAKYDEATKQAQSYAVKESEYQVKIEALGMGFTNDRLDEVLALAKVNMKENQTISDGLKAVKEKYASVFISTTNLGTQFNDEGNTRPNVPKTEQEKHLASNPIYGQYQKQQDRLKNKK